MTNTSTPKIGTREQFEQASRELLAREKELTRMGDELARQRRELPWVPVEKTYRFDTLDGEATLADLFAGRSQLLVYHFMFGPGETAGCVGCSLISDHLDAALPHLPARDVTLVLASRAPLATLQAYRERMGWSLPWVSTRDGDFSYDLHYSFTEEQVTGGAPGQYNHHPIDEAWYDLPGLSAFALHEGTVHHTYSFSARGGDAMIVANQLLDRAPYGRQEDGPDEASSWWRRHDEYEHAGTGA